MKTRGHTLRKTAVAAAVVMAVASTALIGDMPTYELGLSPFISAAYAREEGSGHAGAGGQNGAMGGQRGGQGGEHAAGQGHRGGKSVADVLSDDGSEEDSDRPEWAQTPGRDNKPGGGNAGGSTKKGDDYGDLFVILRDEDGTPTAVPNAPGEVYILLSNGEVIATVDGEVPEGTDASLLQAVEFGRMNIARSPDRVLDHALLEALSKLATLGEDGTLVITADNLESLTDAAGRLVVDGATIDSPLENLALYEALLSAQTVDGMLVLSASSSKDGTDGTYTVLVDPSLRLDLAASALAASSDKTGDLTIDEVMLISSFLDVDDDLATLVTDYSYDTQSAYAGEMVTVLVETQPDVYELKTVPLLSNVEFNTIDRYYIDDDGDVESEHDGEGIDAFVQAADDAVQVIEFVHDNTAP